jgi:hypothetical protein
MGGLGPEHVQEGLVQQSEERRLNESLQQLPEA